MAFNEEKSHPNGWDKNKLISRYVTEGVESAPHRSYYYAMGMTEEQIHQPLVGCLLYTSPSPRDRTRSRMPSSA